MRKLKLQMQISIDGFVAGPDGDLDWMTWDLDDELKKFIGDLHEPVDCILLGGNMAEGFVMAWESRVEDPEADALTHKMVDTRKIVFSKTVENAEWKNTEFEKGDAAAAIRRLKEESGGDIIVYGGAAFVTSLIKEGLIDELNFFVNPAAIGKGMTVFEDRRAFSLVKSRAFDCGVVLICYEPKR